MDQFLKSLTARTKMLDAELAAERGCDEPDAERLMALRRIKRQLGAQIDYIRREGRQISDGMVVRRPRRFTDLNLKSIR